MTLQAEAQPPPSAIPRPPPGRTLAASLRLLLPRAPPPLAAIPAKHVPQRRVFRGPPHRAARPGRRHPEKPASRSLPRPATRWACPPAPPAGAPALPPRPQRLVQRPAQPPLLPLRRLPRRRPPRLVQSLYRTRPPPRWANPAPASRGRSPPPQRPQQLEAPALPPADRPLALPAPQLHQLRPCLPTSWGLLAQRTPDRAGQPPLFQKSLPAGASQRSRGATQRWDSLAPPPRCRWSRSLPRRRALRPAW